MRVIYIADDGTQFEDEYACKEYEYVGKMKDKFPTTRFFNSHGKPMEFVGTCEFCEGLYYFDVRTRDEAELLHQFFIDCGFDSPWKRQRWDEEVTISIGYYFYDTNEDKWRNIEELYAAYQEVLNVFEGE